MRLCEILIQFLSSKGKSKDDYMRPLKEEEPELKDPIGIRNYFLRRLKMRHYLKECTEFF